MKKFSLFFIIAGLFAAGAAGAATVLCRSGEILAAEFSTRKPDGAKLSPERYPDLPAKCIYAAVTLRPAPGRAISIYDYTLCAFNREMPCIGMSLDGRAIDPSLKELPAARLAGGKCCTLFFVLDGSLIGFKKIEAVQLRCNFGPEALRDQRILLTNRGSDFFTPSASIPGNGIMATQQ